MPTLLCVFAHPDDEIFCSGMLSMLKENVDIYAVYLTCGEGGSLKSLPEGTDRVDLKNIRLHELKCSSLKLGFKKYFLMGYKDPVPKSGVLLAPDVRVETLDKHLLEIIEKTNPEVVVTHGTGGEYGHPAHIMLNKRVRDVLNHNFPSVNLYSFAAMPYWPKHSGFNVNDFPDLCLDVSVVKQNRIEVMACHRSQVSSFLGGQTDGASQLIDKYVSLRSVEYYRRYDSCRNIDYLLQWLGVKPSRLLYPLKRVAWFMIRQVYLFKRYIARALQID